MKSLEFATDFLVMTGQTVVAHHADRIVQTTPAEPKFWFGNRVIFRDPPTDAQALIQQFHKDHPTAEHVCMCWDVPDLAYDGVAEVFAKTDLTIEQGDALVLSGDLTPAETQSFEMRPFSRRQDWEQSEDISFDDFVGAGMPERGMRQFLQQRSATRRHQISLGMGQWFGAFDGDILVGDMGIFASETLIRYQSVQTAPEYRRRGVCSSLLRQALAWAREKSPKATPVIVADADSDAGRLYRRAGFELAQTTISASRPPPA